MKEYRADTGDFHSIEDAKAGSLAGREREAYGNRLYCCAVGSPATRPHVMQIRQSESFHRRCVLLSRDMSHCLWIEYTVTEWLSTSRILMTRLLAMYSTPISSLRGDLAFREEPKLEGRKKVVLCTMY